MVIIFLEHSSHSAQGLKNRGSGPLSLADSSGRGRIRVVTRRPQPLPAAARGSGAVEQHRRGRRDIPPGYDSDMGEWGGVCVCGTNAGEGMVWGGWA